RGILEKSCCPKQQLCSVLSAGETGLLHFSGCRAPAAPSRWVWYAARADSQQMPEGRDHGWPRRCARALCLAAAFAGPLVVRAAAPDAETRVLDGLIALHQFEYEDANDAFRAARLLDPYAVLAYWGEAMTYYQALWRREDVEAARAALARL